MGWAVWLRVGPQLTAPHVKAAGVPLTCATFDASSTLSACQDQLSVSSRATATVGRGCVMLLAHEYYMWTDPTVCHCETFV